MKCANCGRKVFRDIMDKDGETIGKFRMCVNCNTINIFSFRKYKFKRGVFEYDFEN